MYQAALAFACLTKFNYSSNIHYIYSPDVLLGETRVETYVCMCIEPSGLPDKSVETYPVQYSMMII